MKPRLTTAMRRVLERMERGAIIRRTILRKDRYYLVSAAGTQITLRSDTYSKLIANKWIRGVRVGTWYQELELSPAGRKALKEKP